MSDIVYTKSILSRRIAEGRPWELSADTLAEIRTHLAAVHPRADLSEWAHTFAQVVICENDSWPLTSDIADETRAFLLSVRKGEIGLSTNTALSYAEAHREYKRKNRANLAQDERTGLEGYLDTTNIPTALTAKNYACEYEDCFDTVTDRFSGIPEQRQVRRCLRDVLEGIETHLADHKRAGTVSDFDVYLRGRFVEGMRLWETLKGEKWQFLQPKENNLRMVNR